MKGKRAEPIRKSKSKKTDPVKSVSVSDPEQRLLEIPKVEEPPEEIVRNNQFVATFVRPRFEKRKETLVTGFDISFNLVDVLSKLIPKQVIPRWHEVREGGVKRLDMTDIPPQVIDISLFPEDGKPAGSTITLDGALISRARIEEIVSTGDGKETRNVRFSFTAYVEQDKEVVNFAAWKHDATIWLVMKKKQGELAFSAEG